MIKKNAGKILGKNRGIKAILFMFLFICLFINTQTVFGAAGDADSICYFATDTGTLAADGAKVCNVTIKVNATNGNAISGVPIVATSNRSANFGSLDVITYPSGNTTDGSGICAVTISSIYSGTTVLNVKAGSSSETDVFENLCLNGGFEEADAGRAGGAAFWTRTDTGRVTRSSPPLYNYSPGTANIGTNNLDINNYDTFTSDAISVARNSNYYFSAYMCRQYAAGVVQTVGVYTAAGSQLALLSNTSTTSFAWVFSSTIWNSGNNDSVVIRCYARDGSGLNNIDVYFDHVRFYRIPTLTFTPALVSETASYISLQKSCVPANGTSLSTVTVRVMDGSGVPLSGKSVDIYSSRGATDTFYDSMGGGAATQTTDANGACTWSIRSSTEGRTSVTAICDGKTISHFIYKTVQAMWNFDTDSMDASGNGNSAALIANPSWVAGYSGYALDFDGATQYATPGTSASILGRGSFAVEAWIKTTSTVDGTIVSQRDSSGSGYDGAYIMRLNTTGNVIFFTYGGADWPNDYGYGDNAFYSNRSVNDGYWHHIIVVRAASGMGYMYIDGRLDNTYQGTANSMALINVFIGSSQRAPENYFDGTIDEVRIYNSYLGPDDVLMLYERSGNVYFQSVSETNSYISFQQAIVSANGSNTGVLTVCVRDNNGGPIQGKSVGIYSSRGVTDTFYDSMGGAVNTQTTDVNGACTWSIKSSTEGRATAYGYCDGKIISKFVYRTVKGIWNFDATTVDASGQMNSGTLTNNGGSSGNPTWTTGKYGQAINLNPNDATTDRQYVDLGYRACLFGAQDFSIEAWVKKNTDGNSAELITQRDGSYAYVYRVVVDIGGAVACSTYGIADYGVNSASIGKINDNTWHHIVVTMSSAAVTSFYLDGSFDDSFTGTPVNFTQHRVTIGANNRDMVFFFGGAIDDFRLYTNVLSAQEVKMLYERNGNIYFQNVNETISYIGYTPAQLNADGTSRCTVTAKILDTFGSPLFGKQVTLISSRGSTDTIRDSVGGLVNPQYTNAQGVCTWTITTSAGGLDTLSLTVAGKTITNLLDKQDIIGAWNFDQNLIDESGYGNNGYKSNGVSLDRDSFGLCVNAIRAGLGDYVQIPRSTILDSLGTGTSYSLAFWFKCPAENIPTSTDVHFLSKWLVGPGYPYTFTLMTDGTVQFRDYDGTNATVIGTNIVADGQWHHIVGVRDVSTGLLYVYTDGVLRGYTADLVTSTCANASDVVIGGTHDFQGYLDEVRIYKRALNAQEAMNNYQRRARIRWLRPYFNFTTSNFKITPNNQSFYIGVEAFACPGETRIITNETATLTCSPATGKFSVNRVTWTNTTIITLVNGYKEFYFKDSTVGTSTITISRSGYISDTLTVTVVNQTVSATASYINFNPYRVLSDSITLCTATVVINDTYGFPINGRTVRLTVTRSNSDVIVGNPGTTNSSGQCTFSIRSSYTGFDTITAICDGVTITRGVNKYGAIGIWHFDTDLLDVSGYGNNGTFNALSEWIPGKEGGALNFQGYVSGIISTPSQYLTIPHSSILALGETTTSYSIEFWFRSSQIPIPVLTVWDNIHFLVKLGYIAGYETVTYPFSFVHDQAGAIEFRVYDGNAAGQSIDVSTGNITDGQWHHIVGVRHVASSRIKLYVDGILVSEKLDTTKGYYANTGDVLVGMAWGLGIGNIDLDELRIYNRILSENEIYADYKERANIYFYSTITLNFWNYARTTSVGGYTPYLVAEALNDQGIRDTAFEDSVTLTSASATGKFSATRGTGWNNANYISLISGVASFYYKDTATGSPIITISRGGCISDSQTETIVAQTVHNTVSYIVFDPYEVATDNISTCNILVNIRDTFGFPISNVSVTLVTSKGVNDTINDSNGGTANPQTTDINGQCTWTIKSSVPGKDTITATCLGKTITRGVNKYGTVAMWNFDDNVKDFSGYGNDLAEYGNFYWNYDGYGFCMFDTVTASIFLEALNSTSISQLGSADQSFTVEFWFKNSVTSATGDCWFLNKIPFQTIHHTFSFIQMWSGDAYPNSLRLTFKDGDNYSGTYVNLSSKASIADGKWHHIVGKRDYGNRLYLYVDGTITDSITDPYTGLANAGKIDLGYSPWGGQDFKGELDEVKIYTRALSDTEIYLSRNNKINITWKSAIWFSTPAFYTSVNNPSRFMEVEYGSAGARDTTFNGTATLLSSSSTGKFSIDRVNWIDITTITFVNGYGGIFYYKDSTVGVPQIQVFRSGYTSAIQTEHIVAQYADTRASYIRLEATDLPANASAACTAIVTIKDTFGFPISGRSVMLVSNRGAWDVYTPSNPQTTNSLGNATFYIKSGYSGIDTITAICDGVTITQCILGDSIVGMWDFDNTFDDVSGNGNNGTAVGAFVKWMAVPDSTGYGAAGGSAPQFPGGPVGAGSYVSLGTGPSITGIGPVSVELWIKTPGDPLGGDMFLVCQRDGTGLGFEGEYILRINSSGTLQWTIYQSGYAFDFSSLATVTDNSWHHLVATRESDGTGKIYIDGYLDTSQLLMTDRILNALTTINVYIGSDVRSGGASNFYGLMDQVRIYNKALTADEVLLHYQRKGNMIWRLIKFGWTNPAATTTINNPTPYLLVEAQGILGGREDLYNNTVSLSASSGGGRFSKNRISWSDTTSIMLNNGYALLYYKDSSLGGPIITASRPGVQSGTQTLTIVNQSTNSTASFMVLNLRNIIADNATVCTVAVSVNDTYGFPINNKYVSLYTSRGPSGTTIGDSIGGSHSAQYTNVNGVCTFTIRSSVSGWDTVVAVCDGNSVTRCFNKEGAVLILNFDTGLLDISGNANAVSFATPNPVFNIGKFGSCIDFSINTGSVNITNSSNLNVGAVDSDYSIEFWFYCDPSNIPSDGHESYFITKTSGSPYPFRFSQHYSSQANPGNVEFRLYDGTYSSSVLSSLNISDGNWHYIVAVRDVDNNQIQLWVDGNLDGIAEDITVATCANNGDIVIGYGSTTGNFNGLIDEFKMYNKVLSSDEIKTFYANRSKVFFSGVSANASYILFTPYNNSANGISAATISVTVHDTFGNPVPGRGVVIAVSRGNSDTIKDSIGGSAISQTTDINGICTWTITSGYAGFDTITAVCDAVTITRGVNKSGVVSLVNLDGNIFDISGYGNNSSYLYGSALIPAKYSFGLDFDSTTLPYEIITHSTSINLGASGTSYSVVLWVKSSSIPVSSQAHFFIKYNASAFPFDFAQHYSGEGANSGKIDFRMFNGATTYQAISTNNLSDGNWHQLVGVRDTATSSIYLYVDGALNTQTQFTSADFSNASNIRMGTNTGYGGNNFDGTIDEVRIYNRVLSAAEISADYAEHAILLFSGTRFRFKNAVRIFPENRYSDYITTQLEGESGGLDTSFSDTIQLSNSSATGKFSLSTVTWIDTTVIYMLQGSATYYYRNSAVGTYTISVSRSGYTFCTQTIVVLARQPSNTASYVSIDKDYIPANGSSRCTVIIAIRDSYGETVSNATVTISTSRGTAYNTIVNPSTTDLNGICTGSVYSAYPGWETITAYCQSLQITKYSPSGPVGFWPFEENYGSASTDISCVNNDGNLGSGVSWTSGKLGYCLNFTGAANSYFIVPDSPTLRITGALSVSMWINANILSANNVLLMKSNFASYDYGVFLAGNQNVTFGLGGVGTALSAQNSLSTGNWYHVVGVYNGSTITVYINGAKSGNAVTASGAINSSSNNFGIGCDGLGGNTYTGMLDEVKIFNRALSDTEVSIDYRMSAAFRFIATRLSIITTQQTVLVATVSNSIAVEARGLAAAKDDYSYDTILLQTSSATGKFSLSSTTWSDTTNLYLSSGTIKFYYKDSTSGTHTITVSRTGLSLDTQFIVISGNPLITTTKTVKNIRTNIENTFVYAVKGDTMEYKLTMVNAGPATGTNLIMTDTITFDTSINGCSAVYVTMDTYASADTWAYTLNLSTWIADTPTTSLNIKGLRWGINAIGPSGSGTNTKTVRFRIRLGI